MRNFRAIFKFEDCLFYNYLVHYHFKKNMSWRPKFNVSLCVIAVLEAAAVTKGIFVAAARVDR
jgi:hypothetical protein